MANVLHHNDLWNQQVAVDADVKKEIRNLINCYKSFYSQVSKQSALCEQCLRDRLCIQSVYNCVIIK